MITDEMERECIAIWKHSTTIFMYPFSTEVFRRGCKVLTRDGRKVRKIEVSRDWVAGGHIVTGELDGKRYKWTEGGRFRDAYTEDANDLYIPERYFDPQWKEKIKLSNFEWASKYQKEHPYTKIPERYGNDYKGFL